VFSQASLDLFANFHSIGVNIKLTIDDPEMDARAELQYGTDAQNLKTGYPVTRVYNEHKRLSGSVFWCQPNTTYFVKVMLYDPTTPSLNGITLTGSIRTRKEPEQNIPTKTYFVSPYGTGTGFTLNQPGNLIQALVSVKAGEKIVLLGGHYFGGNLSINQSGTANAPIVLEAYNGDSVVIDGADTTKHVWQETSAGSGLYYISTKANNPNLVIADGIRLYPFRSLDELNNFKIGIGFNSLAQEVTFPSGADGFFRNPSTNPLCNDKWQYPNLLYVKFRDGSDPNKKKMVVTQRNNAFNISNQNHIQFRNITFANFGVSPGAHAVSLSNCSEIVFDSCVFAMNDIGLLVQGNSSNITVQHCEFFDANFSWSAWKMKATYDDYLPYSCVFPNYSRLLERGGLNIQHGYTGRGLVVRNCYFHDFSQAGHGSPPSYNATYPDSYEMDFYDNRVSRCFEDGLEIDGDARNIRFWNNTFSECNAPLSLATARSGPLYIIRNTFHALKPDTFTMHPDDGLMVTEGHPFKTNYGSPDYSGQINFFHNTIDGRGNTTGFDFYSPNRWHEFNLKNNLILTDSGRLISYRTPFLMKNDLDYNGYFSTLKPAVFRIDSNYSDSEPTKFFNSLSDLTNYTGWEKNGIYADPMFVNRGAFDFRLKDQSPFIDKGVIITGINDRHINGLSPDMGAHENGDNIHVRNADFRNTIKVFPNPNNGAFQIEIPDWAKRGRLEIWTMEGQLVQTVQVNSSENYLPIQNTLPSGVYQIRLLGTAESANGWLIIIH
jgi:hypothetical protein